MPLSIKASSLIGPDMIDGVLTHWGRVTHICVSKLTIIGSDNGLSPGRRPSHYLNQCWDIVNQTLRNKLQWNVDRNSNIFIHENAFENVVCQMASILSRPQGVKQWISLAGLGLAVPYSNVIWYHIQHSNDVVECHNILTKGWDVITCSSFNISFTKPLLNLRHAYVITNKVNHDCDNLPMTLSQLFW